jgi:hypothetical protein
VYICVTELPSLQPDGALPATQQVLPWDLDVPLDVGKSDHVGVSECHGAEGHAM